MQLLAQIVRKGSALLTCILYSIWNELSNTYYIGVTLEMARLSSHQKTSVSAERVALR